MFSWLWQFIKPYRSRLILAFVALLFTSTITLSIGEGIRVMVDKGFGEESYEGLKESLFIFMSIITALSIGTFFRFYLVSWIGERVVADIRISLYKHLVGLPPSFFEDNLAGEIQSRVTTDTTLLEVVIGSSVSFALRNAITFTGGLILMLVSNVKLTLIVLAVVPFLVFPLIYFGRKVKVLSRESQEKVANVGAWASESLQHIKVVQAFTREDMVTQRFTKSAESAFQAARKRIQHRALLIAMITILIMGAVACMLFVGGLDVINGELTSGELAAFVFYAMVVAGSLGVVTAVYGEVQRASGAVERIRDLFNTKTYIKSPSNAITHIENSSDTGPLIEFENVNYVYPSRPNHNALDKLTLKVNQGERIALVGPSGAGKSTLFDLLLRFRDPQSGVIRIAGHNMQDLDLQTLRDQFAIVPQQPVLFSASVFENLKYGAPEASEEQVIAAAKAAHAHEFITQLPNGYDAFLGEQGVKLSGGQKQRLAIARAILRDPKILLLDEATSALDAQSEHLVQKALDELMKGRTTFVIAHRLATVAHVNRIAVLDQGKLVAVGSHSELLTLSPLYARLAQLQFRGYEQEVSSMDLATS